MRRPPSRRSRARRIEEVPMAIDWDEFERTRGHEQERLDQEHPELAYRRGVQQGAYFVLEALEADPDAIDRKLLADIRRYVNSALAHWRYNRDDCCGLSIRPE
jgi:hypothetical protein